MKTMDFKITPVACPICGQFMVREKVTRHMKRVLLLQPDSPPAEGGKRFGVMAWRGAFCCHRFAMVAGIYRLLDSNPGGVGKED